MKLYVQSSDDIGSYRGYSYGIENSGDQRYYFRYDRNKFCYADSEEELKSKIDKWIDDEDDSEFITSATQPIADRISLAETTMDRDELARLAKDGSVAVRKAVIENNNTPTDVLWRMYTKESSSTNRSAIVRKYVLYSGRTSSSELEKMAQDPSEEVRMTLARQPSTPTEILEILSRDKSPVVRDAVLRNYMVTDEIVEHMAQEDPHEKVRKNAEKRLKWLQGYNQ